MSVQRGSVGVKKCEEKFGRWEDGFGVCLCARGLGGVKKGLVV